jgi:hypothetical protein
MPARLENRSGIPTISYSHCGPYTMMLPSEFATMFLKPEINSESTTILLIEII